MLGNSRKKALLSILKKGQIFKSIDLLIWIPVLVLSIFGILFIYSSSLNVEGEPHHLGSFPKYMKQIIWVCIGISLGIGFSFFPWRELAHYSIYLMPLLTVILLITYFLPTHSGTYSWIRLGPFSLQPSELTKIFYILSLSFILIRYQKRINDYKVMIPIIILTFVPIFIIILQRDMGTASVYLPIIMLLYWRAGFNKIIISGIILSTSILYFITVVTALSYFRETETLFYSVMTDLTSRITIFIILTLTDLLSLMGLLLYKKRYYFWIIFISSILLCSFALSIFTVPTEKGFGLLGRYQVERLVYPLDNDLDLATKYNIEQAQTAIGAGGLTGKGYLKGNLSHRRFVPEQPTDFIFSILGEEWGWVGSVFILILYAVFLIRIIFIMTQTIDQSAYMILSGLFVLFFYHMTINIGMNIGMVPVIGIPLMFISYGGTAICTAFIGIGIICNISRSNA